MNLINRIKPIYLLLALLLLVVPTILLLITLIRGAPEREKVPQPTLTPAATVSPTIPPGVKTMSTIRAAPFSREDIFYLPNQPVELTFTEALLPQSVKYTAEPNVETKIEQGSIPNAIIISPVRWWEDGTTKITVLPETISQNGAILGTPFIYELRVSLPPAPDSKSEENY